MTVLIRRISSPILVLLVELCKSLKELLSLSFLDCGCKGKDFFLTSKFFGEKFSSFFSQADLRAVGNYRLAQPSSSPTQGYLHVSIISEAPFSLESGCKDKAIISLFPNILAIIFQVFYARHHKSVTGKTLGGKLFSRSFNKGWAILPGSTGSRRDPAETTTANGIVIPELNPFKDTRERL